VGHPVLCLCLGDYCVYFADPVGSFEDFAGFGAIGGAYYAVVVHHVDEVGSAAVADAEAAL
jgi:hypothetical protein